MDILRRLFDQPINHPITPDEILKRYSRLKSTPSGDLHYDRYMALKSAVSRNPDALYTLLKSGRIDVLKMFAELLNFGGNGGSVSKQDNLHWIPFLNRVRQNYKTFGLSNEIEEYLRFNFEWLGRVHDYWSNN